MKLLIFLAVWLPLMTLFFTAFWYFDSYRPRKRRERYRSSLAYLERACEVPLAALVEQAEKEAERQWHEDWTEWRLGS